MSVSFDSTLRALGAALIACAAVACDGSETVDAGDDPPIDGGGRLDSGARDDAGEDVDAGPPLADGEVQVLRDEHGVPHIVAADLASAMYALGWLHAEDRLFQMWFRRMRVEGRLAEHFAVASPSSAQERSFNQRLIDSDLAFRTMGQAREAQATVAAMPAEYRALLEAYAAGVNAQLADRASLGTAFDETGNDTVDPWTAAAALHGWDSIGETFGSSLGAANQEIALLNDCASGTCSPLGCGATVIDDEAAAVPPPTDGMWPPSTGRMASRMPSGPMRPPVEVKASQGFVIAAEHVTTGRPVIFGEPQLALEAPSTWYDHHIVVPSEGIDARGVGLAGSPGMLIFYNRHVAQTVTAGGGDLADLFEVGLGSSADTYVVDGADVPFETVAEQVLVRGDAAIDLDVRITRYGPIVSDVLNGAPAGRLFAMRRAHTMRPDDHSVVAGIELMRAHTLEAYRAALRHWVAPTVSALYAGVDEDDGESHIAFHSLVTIPDRVAQTVAGRDATGRHPYDGSDSANDWRGMLDLDWNPHSVDPEIGYLFSGNHLPVGTWYDAYVYSGIRGNGDSYRSFEIRRRLGEMIGDGTGAPVEPSALHALHVDAGSDVIRLFASGLRELQSRGVIPADDGARVPRTREEVAARVLTALTRWENEGGGLLDQRSVGAPLAAALQGRMITAARTEDFACVWGAAEGGATHFLRELADDPRVIGRPETEMMLTASMNAWTTVLGDLGADVSRWSGRTTPEPFVVPFQRNFACLVPGEGNGCSLAPAFNGQALINQRYTHTISSAHGSSWPFTVSFADVDDAHAILAPGISEEPTSPRFDDQLVFIEQKGDGDIEGIVDAPLDLTRVTVVEQRTLTYVP